MMKTGRWARTTCVQIALGGVVAAAAVFLNTTHAKANADPGDDDPTYGTIDQQHDAALLCRALDMQPMESTVATFIVTMYNHNFTVGQSVDTLNLSKQICPEYAMLIAGAVTDLQKAVHSNPQPEGAVNA